MLVRAAGRRQQRHTCRVLATASFAQLSLPWLAPAQLRWNVTQASTPTRDPSSSSPRRQPTRRPSFRKAQLRSLATAADSHISTSTTPFDTSSGSVNHDEYVPFDFANVGNAGSHALGRHSSPVILSTASKPDPVLRVGKHFAGSTKDLLGHLHTSLSVGRRDRAAAIVQRLARQHGPHSEEAVYAHSVYLNNILLALMMHGRSSPQTSALLTDMQRWFEVEVRSKGTQPDASILVTMMRASIRGLEGSRRDRSIRRYADIAQHLGDDVLDDVLLSEEYDDNEFAILGRATEEFYEEDIGSQPAAQDAPEAGAVQVRKDRVDLSEVPQVLQTEQKGSGLASIKKTMDIFAQLPNLPLDANPEEQRELALKRQRRLEDTAVDVAIERWKKADEDLRKIGIHTSMQSKPISALMWQWYSKMLPALEQELVEVQKALAGEINDADRVAFGPYLELLPIRKVAANTILYLMSCMAGGKNKTTDQHESETKLGSMAVNLSKALESECLAEVASKGKKPKNPLSKAQLRRQAVRALQKGMEKTQPASKARERKAVQAALTEVEWPIQVHVKLGAMLVSKLMQCAQLPVTREHPRTKEQITQLQPAFLHRVKYQRGKRVGVITPNPALMTKIQSEPIGSLLAKRMPMVVEPLPWKGWDQGGYLHYSSPILRLAAGDRSAKDYFMAADQKQDLDTLYKGLTALGKVPWKVHQDVFKVQLEAWNSGEPVANFAPLDPELPMPSEPDSSADQLARRQWVLECREIANQRTGNHSKRCFQNFQLEIARTMLNETLYFPHNLDFRGRAYPIPPYLNHMGADNVRGLLVFAEGKELGENGLRWLKIHTATVAGHDKASMEERVEFTMQHLDDIYDSVRDPLGGRRWWLQAEDAWQTLAACFELVAALESPDPTKYVSHLPVQQDGTCNGLQHYAALGGDRAGAAQVNLEPSDRPADVYTAVAEAVKAEVEKDAKNGDPVAQKLHGRITRKCVKQPVMTNVYGVTFYGARLQVRKQLEAIFTEVKANDPVDLGRMSHYVALKIFKSLGQMFTGAQAIQTWLGQCADRVATCLTPEQVDELKDERKVVKRPRKTKKSKKNAEAADAAAETETPRAKTDNHALTASKPLFKSTVIWTTPLRLPVVQPYRSVKSKVVSTTMQQVAIQDPQVWDPVSRRKQLQAFPPNFIHSLDATHMLLSALKCTENGMTFASIHDSFWTHASDVNQMSEVLRDAFVAMHSEDIIGRLREEFDTRYKGHMYLATVIANSPIGKRIIQRRADIKQEAKDAKVESIPSELALEAERMRLLQSEDAEDRAKGEAMLTPGSILSSESDTAAFAPSTELAGATLGEMPLDPARVEDVTEAEVFTEDTETIVDDVVEPDMEAAEASEQTDEKWKPARKPFEKKKAKALVRKLYVWLPLTFPDVPAKGDFDVRRLRESRYFFH
ncbi:Putative DNA-directed RNA polymerase, phage-type, DNA-directed RNA polymerase domain superfamily [Septoria linicola]|uniref:DNA-directed RNA polymerase n=1 Tax=Septoria linicola TaxID=215465 RepID=A0A9Q9B4A8_9PEZI|nr:putative DNA-directed RNA polymerase, phage-type, DNA-directed RNA polymerase domain superfamily [Septoria linicola]USW56946.1 Putative DNA-directed RNA polymerase, phage-type, DNA-directed RNA polymerase domain superfamily [Septoria linicola]